MLFSSTLLLALGTQAPPARAWDERSDASKAALVKKVAADYGNEIRAAAKESGFSIAQLTAFVARESEGRKSAVSSEGATGLMQTLPAARKASRVSCKRNSKALCQIRQGAGYLKHLRDDERISSFPRIVYAYLHGPSATKKTPDNEVFKHFYVRQIMELHNMAQ